MKPSCSYCTKFLFSNPPKAGQGHLIREVCDERTEPAPLVTRTSVPRPYKDTTYVIGQANNALLYPGVVLGTLVSDASRISDAMFSAAAKAVSDHVNAKQPSASLLPEVQNLRGVEATVAVEVARTAVSEKLTQMDLTNIVQVVQDTMWQPEYSELRKAALHE